LRIELMESEKGTFFQSGVAEPTANGKDILAKLAEELGKLPNKISVEGHTDSKPFAGRGLYGNWELSADRANMARRFMQQSGIRPDQVTQVRGYADQRLRKTDAPEDASNRRVSVIVQYIQRKPTEGAEEKGNGEQKGGEAAAKQGGEAKPAQTPAPRKQEPKK
jgi:chemotaxis protein MotB